MNNAYNHSFSASSQLTQKSVNRCFDGEQHYYSHESTSTKTPMTLVFICPMKRLPVAAVPRFYISQA